jgi:flagellar motor switch/type III secretory pathway protein FliN
VILALGFERAACLAGSRRVRRARFERRSALPVSAACVVANGIRETLSATLAQPVRVRLFEPAAPDSDAWTAIFADAHVYAVLGPLCEAALILRSSDALAIAAAVFGETHQTPRELSPIEEQVLMRAVRSTAGALAPVCGAMERVRVERLRERRTFLTYFELLCEGPVEARIGVALVRDPPAGATPTLRIEDLAGVEVELDLEFAAGEIEAADLLLLQPNTQVRMMTKVGAPAALKLAGRTVARGECGVLGERNAFVVRDGPKGGRL